MNKTEKEASEYPPLFGIGPRVESIWEALGFTATSNNEARQQEKLKAIEKARTATKGVAGGPGSEHQDTNIRQNKGYIILIGRRNDRLEKEMIDQKKK